ncbi:MAG: glutamine synthetase family protein [Candidatus Pacebacteria bacterium]|nr:glutamine synthetase family protein [Candidatus Paceibacterota bacterium]
MEKDNELKKFLEISYNDLEVMNLRAKEQAEKMDENELEKEWKTYLQKEKGIKAITICFSDIEGRFHMLDYDKKFLLDFVDNLTFDGSSIRGFSQQNESDLRLSVDWSSIRFLPSDIFGPGKVILFADVLDQDHKPYISDFRGQLKYYANELKKKNGITINVSAEIEGFLVDGINSEQRYEEMGSFQFISTGGYYHSLPLGRLRKFIDKAAEAQRAMGFKNEKDHPEVAPSQFEMNFSYSEVIRACDNIQLYKLICRQVANNMEMTATFLPKPFVGINGSGMHTNFSLAKNGKNIFYNAKGKDGLSDIAWDFISRILNHASEICLVLNPSVNAYRRLDPHFEAPNQIKVSALDRGSMIRIPIGNERSARIEIRSVAPDANPYLVLYTIVKTGFEGMPLKKDKEKRDRLRILPDNIYDAIKFFKSSDFITKILSKTNQEKYTESKQMVAVRSPKALGTIIKPSEITYHHEVTNQVLWNKF